MRYYGDITKLKGSELPPVDVIVGGSPCQNLSVAGNRKGLEGSESWLFMEQIRIIKEMREHGLNSGSDRIFPRFAVWENVVGAFSCNGGRDFQAVLTAFVRIVEPEAPNVPMPDKGWPSFGVLMGDGWSICYRVHDAQHWGVPQRRRRIALVMDLGGGRAGEVQTLVARLSRNSAPGGEAGQGFAPGTESRSGVPGDGAGRIYLMDSIGGHSESYVETDIANALKSTHYKCPEIVSYCIQNSVLSSGENAMQGFDGYNSALTGNGTMQSKNTGGYSLNYTNLAVYTMQAIGEYKETGIGSACKMRDYKDATDLVVYPDVTGSLMASGYDKRWIVRRLTPMECERLQGFPDGWSEIGIMADGTEKQMSDSTRYKLQGNSIALPYWTFLMRRISAEFEHTPTLGSLFDGQGGFPLIWGRINGPESVLWSSEIDKNAEAVVRKHFGDEDTGLKGDFYDAIQKQFVRY